MDGNDIHGARAPAPAQTSIVLGNREIPVPGLDPSVAARINQEIAIRLLEFEDAKDRFEQQSAQMAQLAEDNAVIQAVIKAMLKNAGHRTDLVENGRQAVAAVANARYDLVLMDMQMPEMDGVTATRKIHALQGDTATIPIIAVTANTMNGDREKYLAACMSDYVAKPIDPMELAAAIARQCGTPAAIVHGEGRKRNATGSPGAELALSDLLSAMDELVGPTESG